MEYTKGPWKWKKSEFGFKNLVGANGEDILYYTNDDDGLHGEETDKSLIAAAPEMYEALKIYGDGLRLGGGLNSLLDYLKHHDFASKVEQALSKAEGRQP